MPRPRTPHESADALQAEVYRQMEPAKRLTQAMSMNRQTRALMDAGLRATHPRLSMQERLEEIARRTRRART